MPFAKGLTRRRAAVLAATAVMLMAVLAACYAYRRYSGGEPRPSAELYPVRGIDISAHNGDIDFGRLAAGGVDFVMMKATEGTNFKDVKFVDNYREARRAGLRVGAYHFFRFDSDSEMQALNFLHSVRNRHLDMPLAVDIEEWGNPDGLATSKIVASLRTMIGMLEAAGYGVVLYTNKDGYTRFVKGNFDNYPLWICSFADPPVAGDWDIWQYSHRGSLPGISGRVDLNVLNQAEFLVP